MVPPDRGLSHSIVASHPVSLSSIHGIPYNPSSDYPVCNEFDSVVLAHLQDLSLARSPRFFGKCSAVMLHQATLQLKHDYVTGSYGSFIPEFPLLSSVSNLAFKLLLKMFMTMFCCSSVLQIRLAILHTRFRKRTSCNPSSDFILLIRIFCFLCSIDQRLKNALPMAYISPTSCLLRRSSLFVLLVRGILMILVFCLTIGLRICPVGGNGFPRFRYQETCY